MSRWKIFKLSKEKKDKSENGEMITQHTEESIQEMTISEIKKEREETQNIVYNEILYTQDFIQKNKLVPLEKNQLSKRVSWENIDTIEHNIDNIKHKKTGVNETRFEAYEDIDQKVDCIIIKKKIRQ